jgi:hypothetical protein
MSPHHYLAVAVRLFAIYFFAYSFQIFGAMQALSNQTGVGIWITGISGIFFVTALLLWFFPMTVAHKLLPKTQETSPVKLSSHRAIATASAILGLVIAFYSAMKSILFYLAQMTVAIADGNKITSLSIDQHVTGCVAIAEFVVGLILILRANWIATKIVEKIDFNA